MNKTYSVFINPGLWHSLSQITDKSIVNEISGIYEFTIEQFIKTLVLAPHVPDTFNKKKEIFEAANNFAYQIGLENYLTLKY